MSLFWHESHLVSDLLCGWRSLQQPIQVYYVKHVGPTLHWNTGHYLRSHSHSKYVFFFVFNMFLKLIYDNPGGVFHSALLWSLNMDFFFLPSKLPLLLPSAETRFHYRAQIESGGDVIKHSQACRPIACSSKRGVANHQRHISIFTRACSWRRDIVAY